MPTVLFLLKHLDQFEVPSLLTQLLPATNQLRAKTLLSL